MGSQKTYVVPHRRKRENKTNYKTRLTLLKSGIHRFVARKSLKHITIQVIQYEAKGDKVLFTVSSSGLKKLGWKHSTSSIPSAYLTGLLTGKKVKNMKITEGIFDLGLQPSIKGSRLYAALKGLLDAGVNIPASDNIFPSKERIEGKHITEYKKNDIEKDIEDVKKKILA